ncbi:MAG TPA: acetate/propionate family kinase [Acidocella sp.]|uniref:acetate/propionate family kinase n=1 Tax=Acidocella sp. TaxID=50710 RepID=UPI002BB36766|nr:acetate/propionate family kinase [Acidocella sp.]HVE21704.1 acetate/propionate family kinase [Acidocella sp.]
MDNAILTVNAGSSSIKFALFAAEAGLRRLAVGEMENIGAAPHLKIRAGGEIVLERRWPQDQALNHEALFAVILEWVEAHLGEARLIAAGHRIVHGGAVFTAPTRLDADVLARLAKLNMLAPLHEPHNLAAIQAVRALRPDLPQIGCFDTAFHHTMPEIATRFALPRSFHEAGVRRYGFHGISYEYIAGRLRDLAPRLAAGRVIAAHLGNGASLCAMAGGKSVESTMGFTALDGLVMGTRCGSIDGGVLLYLLQARGLTADAVSDLLYKQSGLLGVSGISADMRALLASPEPAAAQAVELFAYSAARHAGALAAALGGVEGLVFTAGIGEHAPEIRAAICARLGWLGAKLSPEANAANAPVISAEDSRIEIRVIPTDEEAMIARHCLTFCGPTGQGRNTPHPVV